MSAAQKRKAANKLLIIGTSSAAIGTTVAILGSTKNYDNGTLAAMGSIGTMLFSMVTITGGSLCSLGSIPLYIVSGSHKRKARELRPISQQTIVNGRSFVSVGIKLQF